MEIVDKRKFGAEGEPKAEPSVRYDDFKPTLAGFQPLNDVVLLRELKLAPDSIIASPDAFAEQCLYCEMVKECSGFAPGCIVRILEGIGTTIKFSDADPEHRYFTVYHQDIIGMWAR
jgi:hypothetical protein